MAPRKIDKYQILQRIATGTQGSVDRAFDPESGKQVAIKTLRLASLGDDSFVRRFQREARLAASVDHPNVVRIYDTGQDGDQHFIAMEFLPETLAELNKRTEFSVDQVALLAIGIANGLGAIHSIGIVHRDMKPQNVLITQDGIPKISDFGIARDETQATITQAGVMMGTPHYMSPEQADGSPADARSDVYALGCMTYQMLTGEVPFRADTPVAVLRKHVDEQPSPVTALNADVPLALAKVVERAMEKEPRRRYANGAEMARALREVGREIAGAKIGTVSSPPATTYPLNTKLRVRAKPGAKKPVPTTAIDDDSMRERDPVSKYSLEARPVPHSKSNGRSPGWLVVVAVFGLLVAAAVPVILGLLSGGLSSIFATTDSERVEVVHWSASLLMDDGLLPEMARRFNGANFQTENGKFIRVQVNEVSPESMFNYLERGVRAETEANPNSRTSRNVANQVPDPTILTPPSDQWLVKAAYQLGREDIDVASAQSIVRSLIGIATYRDIAECLGWPDNGIGITDILALRVDPIGWASYPCAKQEWGERPRSAFTYSATTGTGRSFHLGLYSIATGTAPAGLSLRDAFDPSLTDYVRNIQGLVGHYETGASALNSTIYQAKPVGQFFIMAESDLVGLYERTANASFDGEERYAPNRAEPMVMIYPKEGTISRSNCACIVWDDTMSSEQAEAAQVWIDFLLHDQQQQRFIARGLRPGTDISLDQGTSKITLEYGLNPQFPPKILEPSMVKPEVAAAIDEAWIDVKRPSIVTFVVDTSESMLGDKLLQAKIGLKRAVQAMPSNNKLGLVSFGDNVKLQVPVTELNGKARSEIATAIDTLSTGGQTALYNAIKAGVAMTDAMPGDPNAVRAVVVMTDGQANMGEIRLDDLIQLSSRTGTPIENFSGMTREDKVRDQTGRLVEKADITGSGLALETNYPIQIFFVGIGEDADIQVGRMLAEATSAEFVGVAEGDLADLLERFSRIF